MSLEYYLKFRVEPQGSDFQQLLVRNAALSVKEIPVKDLVVFNLAFIWYEENGGTLKDLEKQCFSANGYNLSQDESVYQLLFSQQILFF